MKSQNLELLLELIGIENFAKLVEHCGGMSFYIPKMPSKKVSILKDIAKKYEVSQRTTRIFYDEFVNSRI